MKMLYNKFQVLLLCENFRNERDIWQPSLTKKLSMSPIIKVYILSGQKHTKKPIILEMTIFWYAGKSFEIISYRPNWVNMHVK